MNEINLLKEVSLIVEKNGVKFLSEKLSVNKNTIERWLLLKNVPKEYLFDICKILSIEIDYSKFSFEDKDQFYTSKEDAINCIEKLNKKFIELGINEKEYTYIEPSAGSGSFYNLIEKKRIIGLDIEPKCDGVLKQDFLLWEPEKKEKNIIIGNPPFGLRGNLALKFVNHGAEFSEFIAFILPQLFESDGKGSAMKRVKGMNLILSEKLNSFFLSPDNKEIKINTVFQIWSKKYKIEKDTKTCSEYVKIYSLSDGGTPGTTRNKEMLYKCDMYIPSTCFGTSKMKIYSSFEELPGRKGYGIKILNEKEKIKKILLDANWEDISFKSTNSALNLRISSIENFIIKRGFFD
jgi:hypothetical protein